MATQKGRSANLYAVLIITWPNLISLARLASVPLIAWMLLENHIMAAFITCILAGLSDILDGFVARILKTPSLVGAYLDPLADKALLVGMYFLLGYKEFIPLWLVALIIFRDVLIIGGALLLYMFEKSFTVKPLMISKINTLFQIITAAWVLGAQAFSLNMPVITESLIYIVTATTILSGGVYMLVWLRYFAHNEANQ